jgi:hypothetical protein
MPEVTPPAPVAVETPPEPAKVEPKETPVAPKIDPAKSMAQQTENFLKQIPAKEEPKKEEPIKVEAPKEPEPDPEPVKLEALPEINKYVLERLPDIRVLGHVGDGKDKTLSIKTYTQLPRDFEFASKADEREYYAKMSAQELRADRLVAEYEGKQQEIKNQEFQTKDAEDVQADVERLQKAGIVPKFQYEPDDPKFDSDPAVKEANAIYALRQKINQQYYSEGRNYFISYEDAAHRYYADKARSEAQKGKESPKSNPERESAAKKVSSPQGADPDKQGRRMPPGSTMRDVVRLYNAGRI